jgi:hypothetical protein
MKWCSTLTVRVFSVAQTGPGFSGSFSLFGFGLVGGGSALAEVGAVDSGGSPGGRVRVRLDRKKELIR